MVNSLIKNSIIILFGGLLGGFLFSQEPSPSSPPDFDKMFLTPNEPSTTENVDPEVDTEVDADLDLLEDRLTLDPAKEPTIKATYRFQNDFYYRQLRKTTVFNLSLFDLSQLENLFILSTKFDYLSGENFFGFSIDNTVYYQIEGADKNTTQLKDNLHEAFIFFELFQTDQSQRLLLGKMHSTVGSGFLVSPINFLLNENDLEHHSRIGYYQTRLQYLHPYFDLIFSYLPNFDTVYPEFKLTSDSKVGTFQTEIGLDGVIYEKLNSRFIFNWNGHPNLGLDLNLSVGEEVIFYSELVYRHRTYQIVKKTNTLTIGTQNGPQSLNLYESTRSSSDQFEGVFGLTYTPKSLVTLQLESYFVPNHSYRWKDQADLLNQVSQNRLLAEQLGINSLADLYRGVLGNTLEAYSPLQYQPLYLMFRVFRDDFLNQITTHTFNLASTLNYSPYDTSFLWQNQVEWVSKSLWTLGLKLENSFGKSEGVFTSIPNEFKLLVYLAMVY